MHPVRRAGRGRMMDWIRIGNGNRRPLVPRSHPVAPEDAESAPRRKPRTRTYGSRRLDPTAEMPLFVAKEEASQP